MAFHLNDTLSREMINSLSNVYIAVLTPSVIGSFSVLVVSFLKWSHLGEQVYLLVQLTVADLLAALILMSTSIMNRVNSNKDIIICQFSLPLSLTFYFISFLLVVIYAWKSMNAIQGWRENQSDNQRQCSSQKVDLPLYALVWFIPLTLYLVYVFTDYIMPAVLIPISDRDIVGDDTICNSCILFLHVGKDNCSKDDMLHTIFIRVILFLMVIAVMLTCSVIYHKVGKWYEKHEQAGLFPVEGDGRSGRRYKRVISTARNMVLVILFCWTPALILILFSILMFWINIGQHSLFALYVIQTISVSLQGFLNSMVYAWRRPNFTNAVLGEHTPLITHHRQAFFEDSL